MAEFKLTLESVKDGLSSISLFGKVDVKDGTKKISETEQLETDECNDLALDIAPIGMERTIISKDLLFDDATFRLRAKKGEVEVYHDNESTSFAPRSGRAL